MRLSEVGDVVTDVSSWGTSGCGIANGTGGIVTGATDRSLACANEVSRDGNRGGFEGAGIMSSSSGAAICGMVSRAVGGGGGGTGRAENVSKDHDRDT